MRQSSSDTPAVRKIQPSAASSRSLVGTPEADALSGTDRGDLLDGGAGAIRCSAAMATTR